MRPETETPSEVTGSDPIEVADRVPVGGSSKVKSLRQGSLEVYQETNFLVRLV